MKRRQLLEDCLGQRGAPVALLLVVTGSLSIAHQARHTYHMKLSRADLYIEPSHSWVEPIVNFVETTLGPGEQLFVYGHEGQIG